jgi:hypothetical protein
MMLAAATLTTNIAHLARPAPNDGGNSAWLRINARFIF